MRGRCDFILVYAYDIVALAENENDRRVLLNA